MEMSICFFTEHYPIMIVMRSQAGFPAAMHKDIAQRSQNLVFAG
jgi:hypothetical protein